jgi:hypothetical protein
VVQDFSDLGGSALLPGGLLRLGEGSLSFVRSMIDLMIGSSSVAKAGSRRSNASLSLP